MCAERFRGAEASGVVDRRLEGEAGHRPDTRDRHQAATDIIPTRQCAKRSIKCFSFRAQGNDLQAPSRCSKHDNMVSGRSLTRFGRCSGALAAQFLQPRSDYCKIVSRAGWDYDPPCSL